MIERQSVALNRRRHLIRRHMRDVETASRVFCMKCSYRPQGSFPFSKIEVSTRSNLFERTTEVGIHVETNKRVTPM